MKYNWSHFNINPQGGLQTKYEDLCLDYFLIENNLKHSQVDRFSNQTGIEIKPVQVKNKKYISFQAKYTGSSAWAQFKKSLKKAIDYKKQKKTTYEHLTEITCFTNREIEENTDKQKKIDELCKKESINLNWIYGDKLLRLINNSEKFQVLIKNYFTHYTQPKLLLKQTSEGTGLYRYIYNVGGLPFIDRDKQFNLLNKFCKSSKDFTWWIITGNAGTGKSRLAFEFCIKLTSQGWQAGFICEPKELEYFVEGYPNKPTFIVVDYVVGQEKYLSEAFLKLSSKYHGINDKYPIRILLLERNSHIWLSSLLQEGTSNYNIIFEANYKILPLHLDVLNDEKIETQTNFASSLIRHFKIENLKADSFLKQAYIVYPKATHLFFYILADLYPEWNKDDSKEDIFRCLLKREDLKRWIPNQITAKNKKNLVLATISGGISINQFSTKSSLKDVVEKHRIMVGGIESSFLEPLLPDLIGELYVLDNFAIDGVILQDYFNKCILKALNFKKHPEIISFFTKSANDYPHHKSLECLIKPFGKNLIDSICWAKTVVNLLFHIDDFEFGQKLFLSLKKETDKREKEDTNYPIFIQLALNNLLKAHSDQKNSEFSNKAYFFKQNELKENIENEKASSPDKVDIKSLTEEQNNLFVKTLELNRLKINAWNLNYIISLESEIENLILKFKNKLNVTFYNLLSSSYSQHELHLLNDLQLKPLFALHEKFYLLINNSSNSNDVITKYLTSSKNIIGVLHNYNQLKETLHERIRLAKKYYDQIINIDDGIRSTELFIKEFSEFISAVILFVIHDKKISWRYFNELEKMLKKYSTVSKSLYYEISRSLVNLSSGFKDESDFMNFEKKLKNIEAYETENTNQSIKQMIGMIYGNLVNHNNLNSVSQKEKDKYFEKYKQLCFDNPDDNKIAEGLLRGVSMNHHNQLNKGEFELGRKYFELLEEVNKLHKNLFKAQLLNSINTGFEFSNQKNDLKNLNYYLKLYITYLPSFLDNYRSINIFNTMFGKIEGLKHGNKEDEVSKLYRIILKQICQNHGAHKSFAGICNYLFPDNN